MQSSNWKALRNLIGQERMAYFQACDILETKGRTICIFRNTHTGTRLYMDLEGNLYHYCFTTRDYVLLSDSEVKELLDEITTLESIPHELSINEKAQ